MTASVLGALQRRDHIGYCLEGPSRGLYVLATPGAERGFRPRTNLWEVSFSDEVKLEGERVDYSLVLDADNWKDDRLLRALEIVWAPPHQTDSLIATVFPWYVGSSEPPITRVYDLAKPWDVSSA